MAGVNTRRARAVVFLVVVTAVILVGINWKISAFNSLAHGIKGGVFKAAEESEEGEMGASGAFGVDSTTFVRVKGEMANALPLPPDHPAIRGRGDSLVDTGALDGGVAFRLLNELFVKAQLDFRRVASHPVPEDWRTPVDLEVLSDDPVRDLTRVAQAGNSTMLLSPWPPDGRAKVGDKVTVRVDLADGRGRPVRKGGHLVRVWLVHTAATGRVRRSIAAADVADMRNGSYAASLPVLWAGRYEARAALMRSREAHRVVLSLSRAMKMTTQVVGFFVSGQTTQATLCSFLPVVPGFAEVCNLTERNGGLPWYCGRPTKTGLRCDHWVQSISTERASTTHVPLDDMLLFQPQFGSGIHLLTNNVYFSGTADDKPRPPATKTCTPLQPRDSWTDQSPTGYWENNVWHPLIGCPLLPLEVSAARRCLRDTSVIFYGDSNTRYWMEFMRKWLQCTTLPRDKKILTSVARCKESNTVMTTIPHAYPYLCNPENGCEFVPEKHALQVVLDAVPTTGSVVIILHLYLHFGPMHSYIYALHVRHAAQAVRQLLARNPGAKVVLRGPHAVCWHSFLEMSDYHARRCLAVLRHEFRALRDHVMFLNAWDMTVANENCDIHPAKPVLQALTRMMLAHVCPTP